jgi:TonB family protein
MTIEAYLGALGARLRGRPSRRQRILDEVRDHLEQVAALERARGADAEAAEEAAVARFGDVELIAREFAFAWRGTSHGGRVAFLWLSVAAASAASLAMTWTHGEPVPSLITLAEASWPAPTTSYRMAPPAPPHAHCTCPHRHAALVPTAAEPEPEPPSPAPAEPLIADAPVAPAVELFRLVELALPLPPSTRVAVTQAPRITPPVALPHPSLAVHYPQAARLMSIEGDVRLRLHVDAAGRVDDAAVVASLGYGLDEMAQDAARNLRFRPATDENGAAVGAYVDWTIHCARAHTPRVFAPAFGEASAQELRFGRSRI